MLDEEKKEKKNPTKTSNERMFLVRYRLPGEKGRSPRKITVMALNQSDAKKTASATIPTAEIVGGPQELDEGVIEFLKKAGKFIARCVGKGCLSYAKTPVHTHKGTLGTMRRIMTREIAQGAGERLIRAGGDEPDRVKITVKHGPPKTFKKREKKYRATPFFGASGAKRKRKRK